jgi:hypothetical protein
MARNRTPFYPEAMPFNRTPLIGSLGALALGAVALAPSAQAQSCAPEPIVHSSYPADGATGVPTNAPVYIYGPALDVENTNITLQDAAGEAVALEAMAVEGGLMIDAYLGLAGNTRHELTVSAGGDDWSASFVTGAGPAIIPGELMAPDVRISVIEQDRGSCGVASAICVIGSVPARLTVEVVVGDEVMSLGGGEPPPAFLASPGSIAADACIRARVREPGGFVSAARRICGSDLERYELAASAAAPRSCDAFQSTADSDDSGESSESGGCALVPSRAAPSAAGLLLGLGALLVARQRRRAR